MNAILIHHSCFFVVLETKFFLSMISLLVGLARVTPLLNKPTGQLCWIVAVNRSRQLLKLGLAAKCDPCFYHGVKRIVPWTDALLVKTSPVSKPSMR
jgi:hypothetical protein